MSQPSLQLIRRLARPLSAWMLATLVALALAWQGVSLVTTSVTDDRPAAVPTASERSGSGDDAGPTASGGAAGESSPDVSGAATDDDSRSGPGDDSGPSRDDGPSGPTPTTAAGSATAGGTPTTAGGASPSTSTSAPGSPQAEAEETRTYNLVGGSAALRFTPQGVTVLWANPRQGFETSIEPEHVNGVKVEFRSDSHRSRVDGWWQGGPVDRVREEAD